MRVQLGDELPIRFQVLDGTGAPAEPESAAPTVSVYDAASTLIKVYRVPPLQRTDAPGWFGMSVRLDGNYAAGAYSWLAQWAIDMVAGVASGHFDIVPGGDPQGPIVSQDFLQKRGSTTLLQEAGDGTIVFGRNPRL